MRYPTPRWQSACQHEEKKLRDDSIDFPGGFFTLEPCANRRSLRISNMGLAISVTGFVLLQFWEINRGGCSIPRNESANSNHADEAVEPSESARNGEY